MKKIAPLIFFLPFLAWGQQSNGLPYYAPGSLVSSSTIATISAGTTAFTIQQPPSPSHSATFQQAIISCSTSTICSFDLELNGSQASATANTVNAINSGYTPQMQAFVNSNSTGGAIIGQYILGFGGTMSVDLSKVYWPGTPQQKNLTVRFGQTTTGLIAITVLWAEN